MLRLQQQQMLLRSTLDRMHEDGLSGAIPDDLSTSTSAERDQLFGGPPLTRQFRIVSRCSQRARGCPQGHGHSMRGALSQYPIVKRSLSAGWSNGQNDMVLDNQETCRPGQ